MGGFSRHWQAGGPPLTPQVNPVAAQWVEACQMLQPLAVSVTQVRMSVPEQAVAARVAQPVPAAVPIAGHTQAPPEQKLEPRQAVVLLTTLQAGVLLSAPQVATVEGFMQKELAPLQFASLSQVQAAFGSAPLQVVSVGQATGADTEKQPCASWWQVRTLVEPLQNVPAAGQPLGAAGQAQRPEPAAQVVTPAQMVAVPHWVQPFDPTTQVSEPPPAQRWLPAVQASVQVGPASRASVAASLPASATWPAPPPAPAALPPVPAVLPPRPPPPAPAALPPVPAVLPPVPPPLVPAVLPAVPPPPVPPPPVPAALPPVPPPLVPAALPPLPPLPPPLPAPPSEVDGVLSPQPTPTTRAIPKSATGSANAKERRLLTTTNLPGN